MLHPSVNLGGTEIHLLAFEEAVGAVVDRPHLAGAPPLAVASANLDHVHHFGRGGRWHGVLEASARSGDLEWLTLLDGQPLVTQVLRRTGQRWPKLAGSDLTRPIIATAEERGVSVGFLGGSPETHEALV
jgi:UDP-N-acetyl-D-mannosaminuronic acid transferase (WecB/TagA/CpsF family)